LRQERRLRVFENRVLSRVFGPKRDEVTGNGENYIMKSFAAGCIFTCTADRSIIEYTLMVRLVQMFGALQVSAGLACAEPWAHASRAIPPTAFLIRS
jgi:hypothetical protein